jgi:hypothetical protein
MSSPKGYPTSQMLVGSQQSARGNHVTIQPQDANLRAAQDVHARFAFRVDNDTVPRTAGANTGNPSSGGATVVVDTATPARVGDFVRFEDGLAQYLEIPIVDVSTNSFTLGAKLDSTLVPAAGDDFFIMRYATQLVNESGSQIVIASPGPSQYVENGVDTEVLLDTAIPANTKAFPVRQVNTVGVLIDVPTLAQMGIVTEAAPASDIASSGLNGRLQRIAQRLTSLIALLPSSLGQKAAAASLAVVPASDYIPKAPVNAAGSIVNQALTATTAISNSAPANAVGFILEAPSDNTDSIRWCIGGTASTTVGMLTEPGRDSGYVPCAAAISVCAAVSGTNAYSIQWILSA